jgi:SPOR domain
MARSNGPFGPAGTRPPARRHPTDDPYAAPPAGQPGGHNNQWPPAPYPDQGGQHGQGYHFPPEPEPNYGHAQPAGYGQPAAAPFDHYPNGMQQPSYPPQQQWAQQPDPRGYDLGNYMPPGPQPYPSDPNHFQQGPDPAFASARQGYADPDGEYDDEDFADADEPGRGRRWMFIAVVALVGAVGVGGALAYTYKSLFASSAGRVPVVRADPKNKAKPSEKMLGRLSDDSAQQTTPASGADPQDDRTSDDAGGPKRVKTISINPGAPQVVATSPPPGQEVSPSVPGIMLDVGQRPPAKAAPPPSHPPRVTLGTPPPQIAPQDVQPQAEAPPPAAKRAPAAPQPPPVAARPPAKHAPPPAPSAHSGAGYVAVLSSQKSRMDALKVFADLQQKYPDALSNRVPDVLEKDLSERGLGTMFRLVVGPPGSRSAASSICGQLKTAGHQGCWVTEY